MMISFVFLYKTINYSNKYVIYNNIKGNTKIVALIQSDNYGT